MQIKQAVSKAFKEKFNTPFKLFSAPGRINIIGEHTDYNEGFVLPAAIDKQMVFAAAKNGLNRFRLYAMDLDEYEEVSDFENTQNRTGWVLYLMGILAHFKSQNRLVSGLDVAFGSSIPAGSGLSSSAALECGFALALNAFTPTKFSKIEIVKLAQKAEHDFAGVQCGIMDQYASVFGKKDHVFKLDCRTNRHEYYPFKSSNYRLVLVNSMVKHALASSEYNLRREECERGVTYFKQLDSKVTALRDISLNQVNEKPETLDQKSFQRSKYIVEELQRVDEATTALLDNNFNRLGELLYATHDGLQNLYEVSCKELDFLVDQTREMDDVLGSRMMGGGFGGCTLNIVEKHAVENFEKQISAVYMLKFHIEPEFYHVSLCDGAKEIPIND